MGLGGWLWAMGLLLEAVAIWVLGLLAVRWTIRPVKPWRDVRTLAPVGAGVAGLAAMSSEYVPHQLAIDASTAAALGFILSLPLIWLVLAGLRRLRR